MKQSVIKCDFCGDELWAFELDSKPFFKMKIDICHECQSNFEGLINKLTKVQNSRFKEAFELFINQVVTEAEKVYETRWDCQIMQG